MVGHSPPAGSPQLLTGSYLCLRTCCLPVLCWSVGTQGNRHRWQAPLLRQTVQRFEVVNTLYFLLQAGDSTGKVSTLSQKPAHILTDTEPVQPPHRLARCLSAPWAPSSRCRENPAGLGELPAEATSTTRPVGQVPAAVQVPPRRLPTNTWHVSLNIICWTVPAGEIYSVLQ